MFETAHEIWPEPIVKTAEEEFQIGDSPDDWTGEVNR
jgi:hypothetical protein